MRAARRGGLIKHRLPVATWRQPGRNAQIETDKLEDDVGILLASLRTV